jgi:hypothetical protein
MSDMKLIIRTPTINAEKKIVIEILTAYGFTEKDAKLAVENIKDKNSVDEALDWLNENNILANDLSDEG